MRNQYFQQIRGFCIIFVVLIHLPIGLNTGDSSFLWLGIRQFINFPVATFIFLAAYFCKYSGSDPLQFFRKRLKRLLVPYVFWAFFYLVLLPYVRNKPEDEVLFRFFTGYGPSYFLLTLAQLTLITPIIVSYKNTAVFRIISWIITPAYLVFLYYFLVRNHVELRASLTPFPAWYVFYYIGIVYKEKLVSFAQRYSNVMFFFFLLVAIIFSFIESYIIYSYTGVFSFSISQIKLTSIIYSLLIIIMLLNNISNSLGARRDFLIRIGDYAMGIFMLHPFFNFVFKFVFIHLTIWEYDSFPGIAFNHLCILVCSITSSYYVAYYSNKVMPRFSQIIGLK